jgi:8-oxo-dGTP pyrophosphatase MutT (NUDIX family)
MLRHESLLAELREYEPADELEARHRAAIAELLSSAGEAAFTRGHFGPGHITASCYIVDAERELLLLHHHRRLDRWLQMGGHVEPGESAGHAALREGSEESGLRDLTLIGGICDVDVHAIPAGKGEPDHHHFDVRYLARTRTPARITRDETESNALAWVPLAEAESRMNEAAASRVIRKIQSSIREGRFA